MSQLQRQVRDGETDFEHSAWAQFAQMLANALLSCDRATDAVGILTEALEVADPRSALRAHILNQLSLVALHRGKTRSLTGGGAKNAHRRANAARLD